jgi:hypothetical protein
MGRPPRGRTDPQAVSSHRDGSADAFFHGLPGRRRVRRLRTGDAFYEAVIGLSDGDLDGINHSVTGDTSDAGAGKSESWAADVT